MTKLQGAVMNATLTASIKCAFFSRAVTHTRTRAFSNLNLTTDQRRTLPANRLPFIPIAKMTKRRPHCKSLYGNTLTLKGCYLGTPIHSRIHTPRSWKTRSLRFSPRHLSRRVSYPPTVRCTVFVLPLFSFVLNTQLTDPEPQCNISEH